MEGLYGLHTWLIGKAIPDPALRIKCHFVIFSHFSSDLLLLLLIGRQGVDNHLKHPSAHLTRD